MSLRIKIEKGIIHPKVYFTAFICVREPVNVYRKATPGEKLRTFWTSRGGY